MITHHLAQRAQRLFRPRRMLGHTFSLLAPITLSHIPRVEFAHNRRAAAAAIRQHLANLAASSVKQTEILQEDANERYPQKTNC